MTILITGGTGFIGSHTALTLLESSYDILIIDNFSNSDPEVLDRLKEIAGKEISFLNVDLRNIDDIEVAFQKENIDAVIHFAGLKAVGESVQNPLKYYENNLIGTINLLRTMDKYNVHKLIFSSSATVYGSPEKIPVTENMPLQSTNPYGRTKLMIEELLCDIYSSNPDWSIILLRYFNPVGAHESGLIGENPKGIPNNLMPYIAQVASGKLKKLNIFGGDYNTVDGTGVRDYIHVTDLAKGHLKALEKINQTSGIEAYNLGTGKGHSVLEMVKTFEKVTGREIPYQIVERRSGDIAVSFADSSKAQKELDWKSEKSVEQMCEDSWRVYTQTLRI